MIDIVYQAANDDNLNVTITAGNDHFKWLFKDGENTIATKLYPLTMLDDAIAYAKLCLKD